MALISLWDHPKFLHLLHLLGEPVPHVIGYLECMWRVGYQTGNDLLGDEVRVELAAGFPGQRGKLCAALVEAGFVELVDGKYRIHDLMDHAPEYVKARFRMRKMRAKRAAEDVAQPSVTERNNGVTVTPPSSLPPGSPYPLSPRPDPTRQQQQQDLAGSAASSALSCPLGAERMNGTAAAAADLVREIEKRGLSHALARRHASASADPALIREILAYFDRRMKAGKLDNPIGALRSMLRDPVGWGFERTEAGWASPKDSGPAAKQVQTREQTASRVAGTRERNAAEHAKRATSAETRKLLGIADDIGRMD